MLLHIMSERSMLVRSAAPVSAWNRQPTDSRTLIRSKVRPSLVDAAPTATRVAFIIIEISEVTNMIQTSTFLHLTLLVCVVSDWLNSRATTNYTSVLILKLITELTSSPKTKIASKQL